MLLSLTVAAALCAAPASASSERISLELQEADIHNVLRLLAEKAHLNVVVAEDVKGEVTLHLRNVPVRDALDAVMRLKGLGSERIGSIVRVAPLSTLAAEAKERLELKNATDQQRPLKTVFIPVNYARASEMAPLVKGTLSDRGTVAVDARTNTLIVTDVE